MAHVLAQVPDDAREDRWAQEVAPQVVVGEVVWLSTAQRAKVLAIYVDAPAHKGAVLIVHGLGVHPDWGLNGSLRTKLADAGFATLSVQMPVLEAGATREQYRPLYGIAGDRIAAAIRELHRRGLTKVAIVAHSVGASMAAAYLARRDALPIAAWVPVGMLVDYAKLPREPVLDIIAENDFPEVRDSSKVRAARLPADRCSRMVTIPGTNHYFESATDALAGVIAPFLVRVFAGEC
ncbi:MAG: alpha/beta fold hydrolase [Betaproteobacteria bacterium]